MPDEHPDSSCDDQKRTDAAVGALSRRRFMQTVGLSSAAALADRARAAAVADDTGAPPILGPGAVDIALHVNGATVKVKAEPATTLLEVLRMHLGLTGSKEICGRGACGGCSVLVDGKLVYSCMMLAVDAISAKITTIEGLAEGDALDPIQESFIRHDALQCGYCTPGFVMASTALLGENPRPSLDEIKAGLSGNSCRCGSHSNIFNAVLDASGQAPIHDGEGA